MPTPFYHLSLAIELLEQTDLVGEASAFLNSYRGEFLFGNTAPDVQVISGQARETTHFFTLPIWKNKCTPWQLFKGNYPCLAITASLPPEQAAFLAGYLCHLQADWFWVRDIFSPVFGAQSRIGSQEQRLYLHNVLRAYMDYRILKSLDEYVGPCLKQVNPQDWLPFTGDEHLCAWRDFLSPQLEPGAAIQTVEVFASRQGIDPSAFYQVIESEEDMEYKIFKYVPRKNMEIYRRRVMDENSRLIKSYLTPQSLSSSSRFVVGARIL